MTVYRFGYVAMSVHVRNASPSKTMTYKQFSGLVDREAAIAKLERIARMNLQNCLRLLRHNNAFGIPFFRFSSKLIPLANHPELSDWDYIKPLRQDLREIGQFLSEHPSMRVDFHPDHFVLLNTKDKELFKMSLKVLQMHYDLLKGMGINPEHRCVLHVGGEYADKEMALERFILNWGLVPRHIQQMIILENDDASFTVGDALYLCEKLDIPQCFDYHHHLANHEDAVSLADEWLRVVNTWKNSSLPLKMHMSSPRPGNNFRAHADYVDVNMLFDFIRLSAGTVDQIDVMIEAKQKDEALFRLMEDIKKTRNVEWVGDACFSVDIEDLRK